MEKSWQNFLIAMLVSGIVMIFPTLYVINSIPRYIPESGEHTMYGENPPWPMELYVEFLKVIFYFCMGTIFLFFIIDLIRPGNSKKDCKEKCPNCNKPISRDYKLCPYCKIKIK